MVNRILFGAQHGAVANVYQDLTFYLEKCRFVLIQYSILWEYKENVNNFALNKIKI